MRHWVEEMDSVTSKRRSLVNHLMVGLVKQLSGLREARLESSSSHWRHSEGVILDHRSTTSLQSSHNYGQEKDLCSLAQQNVMLTARC